MYARGLLVLLVSYCILQAMADIDDGLMMIDPNNNAQVSAKFDEFKKHFGKSYADAAEEEKRLNIFRDNLIRIQKMNSNSNESAVYGINQFADLTKDEMERSTGLNPNFSK